MKRFIGIMFLLAVSCPAGISQIKVVHGEVVYQYRSAAFVTNDVQSTYLDQSPMISLGAEGAIVSPLILSFNVQTNIFANYGSSGSGSNTSSKQFTWNFYNLDIGILHTLPVATSISAHDAISEASYDNNRYSLSFTKRRTQHQEVRVVASGISFLPAVRFSYLRSREWSIVSPDPIDQSKYSYSLNLSSSGKEGSVTIAGYITENLEKFTDTRLRYYSLYFNGSRYYGENENLDLSVDYDRFDYTVNISGSLAYLKSFNQKLIFSSSVHGRNSSGRSYRSSTIGVNQSIGYLQNEHYRYNVSFSAQSGSDVFSVTGDPQKSKHYFFGTNVAVQHHRRVSKFDLSNQLAVSASLQDYQNSRRAASVALSNGVNATLGKYMLSLNEGITYSQSWDGVHRYAINNTVNVNLTGNLSRNIQGQVNSAYHESHFGGDASSFPTREDVNLMWRLNGSFHFKIPLTIGLSGSTNWYFSDYRGRTYGWSLGISSPQFFIRNLSMTYTLSRTFDHYYQREAMNNSLELRYQWRALSMELHVNDYRLEIQRREIFFKISRPF